MGKVLIIAAYGVYAAFWMRFFAHALVWWKGVKRLSAHAPSGPKSKMKIIMLTIGDVFFFGRLFTVNPALWIGEWVFHFSFLLVVLRHLRYFLDPVPQWVWSMQTVGMIAGYILPLSLIYILVIRLLTQREKYASPANVFLLSLVLAISIIGIMMHVYFMPDIVDVKLFILGILSFKQAAAPDNIPFIIHFLLVLLLALYLPMHIFAAPLVMMEARKRERGLKTVMHEK